MGLIVSILLAENNEKPAKIQYIYGSLLEKLNIAAVKPKEIVLLKSNKKTAAVVIEQINTVVGIYYMNLKVPGTN